MKAKGMALGAMSLLALAGCNGNGPEQDLSTEAVDIAPVEEVDPQIEEAKSMIVARLVDPDSAQFRNIQKFQGAVCGEYNAKNQMGGYSGFETFVVRFEPVKDDTPWLKTECTAEALQKIDEIDKLASGELDPQDFVNSVLEEIEEAEAAEN